MQTSSLPPTHAWAGRHSTGTEGLMIYRQDRRCAARPLLMIENSSADRSDGCLWFRKRYGKLTGRLISAQHRRARYIRILAHAERRLTPAPCTQLCGAQVLLGPAPPHEALCPVAPHGLLLLKHNQPSVSGAGSLERSGQAAADRGSCRHPAGSSCGSCRGGRGVPRPSEGGPRRPFHLGAASFSLRTS